MCGGDIALYASIVPMNRAEWQFGKQGREVASDVNPVDLYDSSLGIAVKYLAGAQYCLVKAVCEAVPIR